MDKYIPDLYQKSIYEINYDKLHKRGIKCLLFDLDNTLVPIKCKEVDSTLTELIEKLNKKGFKIIIFSSDDEDRVEMFKEQLKMDAYSYTRNSYQKYMNEILSKYKEDQIAVIGDEMLKDIAYGNKVGITTILVNPIGKDRIFKRLKRLKEKRIMAKLRCNNLFVKGRYYE